MKKVIGWTFIALNPFTGIPMGIGLAYNYFTGRPWELLFITLTGLWILLYCLWFDGSTYQRNLMQ